MRRRSLLLVLAVAGISAAAAQQIVLEPTNGRAASSTTRVTRPAAQEQAPAPKVEAKTARPQSAAQKPVAKHHAEKQVAAKAKPTSGGAAVAKNEPRETALAPAPQPVGPAKTFPARPAWAMNDTRDSHGLEEDIASAFARDAKLKGSSIRVKVDDDAVTLEGRALGSEERLQAARLAQSYAWNRKLVDHVEVAPRVSAQK
jgi:hypothetical protein